MMPPNDAGKTTPLADTDDVHKFFAVEDVDQHAIASFHQPVAIALGLFFDLDWNLAHKLDGRQIILAQVCASRLGQSRLFHELDQTNLSGNISILGLRLMLRDHAGPSLQHGRGMNVALVVEELRHANFLAQDSSYLCHFSSSPLTSVAVWLLAGASRFKLKAESSYLCSLPNALI